MVRSEVIPPVKVPREMKEALYKYAGQSKMYVSEIVREAIRIYLESHGVSLYENEEQSIDADTIVIDIDEEDLAI